MVLKNNSHGYDDLFMKSDPVITCCEPEHQSFTLKYWPRTNWHPGESGTVSCFLNMCRRSQLLNSFIHHPTLSTGCCPQSHKLIKTSICAVDGGTHLPLQPPPPAPGPVTYTKHHWFCTLWIMQRVAGWDLQRARYAHIFGASTNHRGEVHQLRQSVGSLFCMGDLMRVCRCFVYRTTVGWGGAGEAALKTCNVVPLD